MKVKKLASILDISLLTGLSALAQEKPGNISALEFQTPKNGLFKQYEEGRKQKANGTNSRKTPHHCMSRKSSAENTPAPALSAG
jgi:hypothetical protein